MRLEWGRLAIFRCPKCNCLLDLRKDKDIWVCSGTFCKFAVNGKKRRDIGDQYPQFKNSPKYQTDEKPKRA